MIELTLEYNPELSDRCNFAMFINTNFGTSLTADDVKDICPMTTGDDDYNTEVVIHLENGGEQTLRYNRVDIDDLVEVDYLVGVENPALLRDALKAQLGIDVGPRDLGIDASERKNGLLTITMAGTLCITGKRTFKLRPVLSRAMTRLVGPIQIVPVGLPDGVPADIAAIPYLAGIKTGTVKPKVFEHISKGEVEVIETFDGLALNFLGVVANIEQEITRYGFDTITSNFIFQTVVNITPEMEGSLSVSIGLGTSTVLFQFTEEFFSVGNTNYPPIYDTALTIKCVGKAGSTDLSFYINDKLVSVSHINDLPRVSTEGIQFNAAHVSGIHLYECGIKRY